MRANTVSIIAKYVGDGLVSSVGAMKIPVTCINKDYRTLIWLESRAIYRSVEVWISERRRHRLSAGRPSGKREGKQTEVL